MAVFSLFAGSLTKWSGSELKKVPLCIQPFSHKGYDGEDPKKVMPVSSVVIVLVRLSCLIKTDRVYGFSRIYNNATVKILCSLKASL